ncbi:MAG: glycoside hydrolase family 2 TIM barrel-domain containing protein [Terriglobia bacterium]|jgi:exo-1,4-beta-D-glucosaminidase
MEIRHYVLIALVTANCCLGHPLNAKGASAETAITLRDGWMIQSSANVKENGEVLSTTQYQPKNWYPAKVPTTVLAALVEDRVYTDPYFGMDLRTLPGAQYPRSPSFVHFAMSPESPFRKSWWYRTEFRSPASDEGRRTWLQMNGINYRANVWLNGQLLADSARVVGMFRAYEFDVTGTIVPGSANVLAIEVFAPEPTDLAYNWVNINPFPPDKDMGIWRPVRIVTSGPVTVRHPQVISHLDMPSLAAAHLTITAELKNATQHVMKGVLKGQIESLTIAQEVELGPGESRIAVFTPERFSQLTIPSPRVWWPAQMGAQDLYDLHLQFESNGQISDAQDVKFGIREITSELTAEGHRVFRINGQKILIRGALWWPDMMLRSSPERQEWEIRYIRDLNLNALRMDGKLENEYFLDLCDRYGILLLPGWCCGDRWERWQDWDEENYRVAAESLRDTIRSFRNHPSLLVWLNGDDNAPPPRVEAMYVGILKELNWPNPYLPSATEKATEDVPQPGVKMTGPYAWVPPSYWLTDKDYGGAFGFITEGGPGIVIPPMESLRLFLPKSHMWPDDECWILHAGSLPRAEFDFADFDQALTARLGRADSLEDYVKKSQLMSYEAERAMFEAYGRNKYLSTGVLQQTLNSAWPSLEWAIYDYYLRPAGAYFGTKKACEPLHIQYSYDDRSVVVVNSLYREFKGLKARATVYDLGLRPKFSKTMTFDVGPDGTARLFLVPEVQHLSTTYFLDLRMEDSDGKPVSANFYWLSTKPDVIDWTRREHRRTAAKSFADYTGLSELPPAQLQVSGRAEKKGKERVAHLTVENPTKQLAFFVRLRLKKGVDGEEILPILLQDSYISLLPGERKEITATYDAWGETPPAVEVEGWNVPRQSVLLEVIR